MGKIMSGDLPTNIVVNNVQTSLDVSQFTNIDWSSWLV